MLSISEKKCDHSVKKKSDISVFLANMIRLFSCIGSLLVIVGHDVNNFLSEEICDVYTEHALLSLSCPAALVRTTRFSRRNH